MRKPTMPKSSFDQNSTMTPMIDVIFQMQIFFICTAGFVLPESVLPTPAQKKPDAAAVPIPAPGAAQAPKLETLRVRLQRLDDQLRIELNEQPLPAPTDLFSRLRELSDLDKGFPIIIDIAPDVLFDDLVTIYDGVLKVGLHQIRFATRRRS